MRGWNGLIFLSLGAASAGVLLWVTVAAAVVPVAGSGEHASPRFEIPTGETSVTRTTDLTSGESVLDTTTVVYVGDGDPPCYVARRSGGGMTTLIRMNEADLLPLRYQLVTGDGTIDRQIDFSECSLRITARGESEGRQIETAGPAHTGATLLQHLRVLAGRSAPDRVSFRLLISRAPGKYRVVDAYARRNGEEDLVVPAGTFRCVKIEFGIAGIIGRVFWRTRYQYYYTVDAPHHFVKYVDPDGECIELVEYGCPDAPSR